MGVVVRRRRDGRAAHRVEHGAVHGAVRVGVALVGGSAWPPCGRRPRRVTSMPSSAAKESGRGPDIGRRPARQEAGAAAGSRPGMGTAVAGQRLRLTRLSLLSSVDRARVVLDRPRLDHARGLHVVEQLLALLGAQQRERPVAERADAPGRDVGVLGGEVGARGAALAGPGVRLLERDLVVAAVAHPDLEHALDVHLGDVGPGQPVFRLEELGEDRVVEGLGAQQPDGEGEAPGDLAGLAGRHDRRRRRLAPHPDQRDALGPAGDGVGVGQRVGRVRVARAGRGEDVLLGAGHPRHRLPGRAVALEARDQGGVDDVVLEGPDQQRGDQPAVLPRLPDARIGGPGEDGPPGDARHLLVGARPAEEVRSRCRAPRCESAGRPACTGCSPSGRGCSCRGRRRRPRGRACSCPRCRRSRGRRRGTR